MVRKIYNMLLKKYGKKQTGDLSFADWWPMSGKFKPKELEICVGAILTQNTNWKNVEKALENLIKAKMLSAEKIASANLSLLEELVRPSGFYKQKAKRLKEFCRFVVDFDGDFYKNVTREQLLKLNGIGRETADSILLYACSKPVFIIDAYTRRLFSQLGLITGNENYDELRKMFEERLPRDVELYKEFHALIVEHEKNKKKRNTL